MSEALTLAEARSALQAHLKRHPQTADDRLLLSRTLRIFDSCDVQRLVSEAARRAGLKMKATPHLLRYSFATEFREKNQGAIATLATILGHVNISTTTRSLPTSERSTNTRNGRGDVPP
ncbi:MAG: tyrosine-type recombinase/integrase [Chloroflexi bacterium]|nr:tyrosine-type recombinase/integrase [Chloroflexota bacterium]